jgi:allantoicase
MVGDARSMADGWETKRRRGPGEDWAVITLAAAGTVERLEVDTTHFKGNYPDRIVIEAANDPDAVHAGGVPEAGWVTLLAPTPLQPHLRHVFDAAERVEATHLRLRVLPDGGVARLRAFGVVTEAGWRRHGLAILDHATDEAAEAALLTCCGSTRWAREVAAARPFLEPQRLFDEADAVFGSLAPTTCARRSPPTPASASAPRRRRARRRAHPLVRRRAGRRRAEEDDVARLAAGNRAYEERFGHVFLIRAAGRSAEEMLAALEERLGNDPETELRVAAEQQRQITALRLDKLLREPRPPGGPCEPVHPRARHREGLAGRRHPGLPRPPHERRDLAAPRRGRDRRRRPGRQAGPRRRAVGRRLPPDLRDR